MEAANVIYHSSQIWSGSMEKSRRQLSFCKPRSSLGYRFRVLRTLEKNDMSLDSVTSAEVIGRVIVPRKAVRKETRTTRFAAHLHSEKESGDAHVQINAF